MLLIYTSLLQLLLFKWSELTSRYPGLYSVEVEQFNTESSKLLRLELYILDRSKIEKTRLGLTLLTNTTLPEITFPLFTPARDIIFIVRVHFLLILFDIVAVSINVDQNGRMLKNCA